MSILFSKISYKFDLFIFIEILQLQALNAKFPNSQHYGSSSKFLFKI